MTINKYNSIPKCIGCNKNANEITEIFDYAYGLKLNPEEYIIAHEGTYDMFKPNKFYCDTCYIMAGMPIHNGKRQF